MINGRILEPRRCEVDSGGALLGWWLFLAIGLRDHLRWRVRGWSVSRLLGLRTRFRTIWHHTCTSCQYCVPTFGRHVSYLAFGDEGWQDEDAPIQVALYTSAAALASLEAEMIPTRRLTA